jgi:DNA polymerase/3'-5' exonuclease PolX
MCNVEIARVFTRIADLLELKDESCFRVRSYQRAARAIEYWAVPVDQLA